MPRRQYVADLKNAEEGVTIAGKLFVLARHRSTNNTPQASPKSSLAMMMESSRFYA